MNQYMDMIWLIVSPTPLSFSAIKQFSHLRKRKKQPHKKGYLLGGFNPSEKYQSNWIISPGRDENKTYLKPHVQSSYLLTMDANLQLPTQHRHLTAALPHGRSPSFPQTWADGAINGYGGVGPRGGWCLLLVLIFCRPGFFLQRCVMNHIWTYVNIIQINTYH